MIWGNVLRAEAGEAQMATEFCQKCKQAHPGRACDYDDQGDCAETVNVDEAPESSGETLRDPKKPLPDR